MSQEKFDTEKIKSDTDIVELVSRYATLIKAGKEYKALCLFHQESTPSMTVVPDKNFIHCFGCGTHHDPISFLMAVEGIDFVEACKRLTNGSGTGLPNPKPIPQRVLKKAPTRITSAPPADSKPDMKISKLGDPVAVYTYTTATGAPLVYVARYQEGEKKTIRCWTYGRRSETDPPAWACGHFTSPRPLYNAHDLASRPNAQVLIVEGEKTADAAKMLFQSMVVTTWPGGAESVDRADWSALHKRKVVLLPDNDDPGIKAMTRLAKLLHDAGADEIKGITPALPGETLPKGWDVADFPPIVDAETALSWAKERVFTYPATLDDAAQQAANALTQNPDAPEIPLEAYGGDAAQFGYQEPPEASETQKRPVNARLVGIYDQQHTGPSATAKSLGVISRRMSDVTIRAVDWLWYGKIPCGKVTGISGNPGLGKSQITASLSAVVSVGGKWPVTREQAQLGSVLLLNAEDDADDTLGPRLIAAGADLSKIHIIDAIKSTNERGEPIARGLDLGRDIARIKLLISELGDVRLVIIDPVSAYLGTADSHKMADVVSLMAQLKTLASDTQCAIIMVNHLNKSSGQDALLKTQGSIGFVSHARAVWGVAKDKDNPQRRYFMPLKNNLGSDDAAAGMAYQIEEFHLTDSDPPIITSRIMWDAEPVTQSAEELFNTAPEHERGALDDAEDFLRDALAMGWTRTAELQLSSRKAGHSWATICRAKSRMRIKATIIAGKWGWDLPTENEKKSRH